MKNEPKARAPVWAVRPTLIPKFSFPSTHVVQYYLVERARYFFGKAAADLGAKFKILEEENFPHRGIVRASYEKAGGVTHFFAFDCYAQTQRAFSCCLRFDRQPEFVFSANVLQEPKDIDPFSMNAMKITFVEFCNIVHFWALAAARTADNPSVGISIPGFIDHRCFATPEEKIPESLVWRRLRDWWRLQSHKFQACAAVDKLLSTRRA
jgi:hypothetical protein